jgi:hypothetical protein
VSLDLFTEIRSVLLVASPVTELVGSGTKIARIWNSWQRTNTYPCAVVEIDDDAENPTLDGTGDMVTSSVTITCRDNTEAGAKALRDAVKAALGGHSGTFDAILDSSVRSAHPKGDGSTDHWYDNVMSWTLLWRDV